MKIGLQLQCGKRTITLTHVWFDPINKAWICIPDRKPFKELRQYRLTNVLFWLYTGDILPTGFIIHHRDGDPGNNEFNNFELTTRKQHAKIHHTGVRRSKLARRHLKIAAQKRARTPEFRRLASKRAKRQHRQKNFGAWTWRRK